MRPQRSRWGWGGPLLLTAVLSAWGAASAVGEPAVGIAVTRLPRNPIITPESHPSIGHNINGPAMIRVPAWVERPLGAYYLYFADHNGKFIRLAYADRPEGPWKVHPPGVLPLAESHFTDHVASPDVVVDEERKQIRLYYHGLSQGERSQHTRVALSEDGLRFAATREPVGKGSAYWRVYRYDGWWYALAMPGKLFRSRDGLSPFEAGPQLFPASPTQIHNAVLLDAERKDLLHVCYTRAGDAPERILYSRVTLGPDWTQWKVSAPEEALAPEQPWEGADLPVSPAKIGAVEERIRALRDPAFFREDGRTYLVYAIAGESGLAMASVRFRAVP